jgi:hypothetical protein
MSWATAHRVAHIAAVHAHHDLGMAPGQFPVPVETAITTAGLPLHWQPLGQLFGIYLQVQDKLGILVNERLTRSARRHTAAHELGHHRFRHATGSTPGPPARSTPVRDLPTGGRPTSGPLRPSPTGS